MMKFTRRIAALSALTVAAFQIAPAGAQVLTTDQARKQIAPFYDMLNQPGTKDLKALSEAKPAAHRLAHFSV